MKFYADSFLEGCYHQYAPRHPMPLDRPAEWDIWRERLKASVLEAMGEMDPPGFMPGQMNVSEIERIRCKDHTRLRVVVADKSSFPFPAYVLVPDGKEAVKPAVVALHGHGYGSRELVGLEPDDSPRATPTYQKDFGLALMRRGFIVVAPELMAFGDCRLKEDEGKPAGQSSCHRVAMNLLMMGRTLAGMRVWQAMRAVDYLLTRADIDPRRIGAMGISGGGLVTTYFSAVDERVRAAVVSGYANTFHDSVMAMLHCVDNFQPSLLRAAEMEDILGLIAPRPMLLEAGTEDPIFPLFAVRATYQKLQKAYALLRAPDHLDIDIFRGDHQISGAKAYDFLLEHLQ